jgi:hypothetical protein
MGSEHHSKPQTESVAASEPLQTGDGSTSGSHPRPDSKHPSPKEPASTFLKLPAEVRLQICFEAVKSARPFLIGRCQDETRRKTNGSPRDKFPEARPYPYDIKRNDEPNRPVQPSITRVCWQLRNEALPLFYAENDFWLIHNEFHEYDEDDDLYDEELRNPPRNFDPWVEQTPSHWFDRMQHVTLCGYFGWPSRVMIGIDVKRRSIGRIRWYRTFGDELPAGNLQKSIDKIRAKLSDSAHPSGITALKAALKAADWIWNISERWIMARPFRATDVGRRPQEGWEYDW